MVDVGLARHGGLRDDPLGIARVGRDQRAAVARVVADPHRHLDHRLGVEGLQRAAQLRADGRAAQLEDRLVLERGQGHGDSLSASRGSRLRATVPPGRASSSSSGTPRACS